MITTMEELRDACPELLAQVLAEAEKKATEAERERFKALESIAASVGDDALMQRAKYQEPMDAAQLALVAMQAQAKAGRQHLEDAARDFKTSGAAEVGALPNGGADGNPTAEQEAKAAAALYQRIKEGETI